MKHLYEYSVKDPKLDEDTPELTSKYFEAFDNTRSTRSTAKEWHIYFKPTKEMYRKWVASIKYDENLIINFKSDLNKEEFEDFTKLYEEIIVHYESTKYNI